MSDTLDVKRFLAKRDYAGADFDIVRRLTAVAMFLTALFAAALAPVSPPTVPIGYAGWGVLVVIVGGFVLLGLRLQRTEELRPNVALALHYVGLASIALLVWLSDGRESPYTTLFLFWMGIAGATHPPRRVFTFIGVSAVIVCLPFAYDDWSGVFAGDVAMRLVVWSILTVLSCVWTTNVRAQRSALMQDEEHAKKQARLDALTGLGNRRAFDERLDRELEDAKESGLPLSVIVSDLDDFKHVNDAYGHLNGDELLRTAAAAMRAAVRDHDICYRWGGDEFAVLLPGLEQDKAEKVAERISASVVAQCTRPDGEPQTLAWGIAEMTPDMAASDLLASADLALMTRKHQRQGGRRFRAEAPDSETT